MMQASWPIKIQETRHTRNCTKNWKQKCGKLGCLRYQSKDLQRVRVIKSKTGEMLMDEKKVKQRWKEYFDNLLN